MTALSFLGIGILATGLREVGKTRSHTYNAVGAYAVTLTVKDAIRKYGFDLRNHHREQHPASDLYGGQCKRFAGNQMSRFPVTFNPFPDFAAARNAIYFKLAWRNKFCIGRSRRCHCGR